MGGWSWDDLQRCPQYYQRAFWDIAMIRRSAEAQRAEQAQREQGR